MVAQDLISNGCLFYEPDVDYKTGAGIFVLNLPDTVELPVFWPLELHAMQV
jgi:hypothetical protein